MTADGTRSDAQGRGDAMTSFEISLQTAQNLGKLNRQGVPCFLGSTPAHGPDDLRGADVAILGVPFVSPLIGYENDVAPRKVRIAGLFYAGSYIAELDIDPADTLTIVDYGDVAFPFGDTPAASAAVSAAVGEVLAAGCLPVTIGGNAPAASFAVAQALAAHDASPIGVISFDGHTDTAADWGDAPNSSNWVRAASLALAALRPENHVQIGMRGMNNRRADMAFFRERGMRTIMAPEVHALGSKQLAAEAVAHAGQGVDRVWLAVDLDVLDNADAPDWDWPDPYGVRAADILETAYAAGRSGKLCGISLMMIGGMVHSVQRLALWIVLYGLAGVAADKAERSRG
jgi:arginase family enzyme